MTAIDSARVSGGRRPGQAAGEHGLARARRAEEEQVVAAGRGHLERPLGRLLAPHLGEVGAARPAARTARRGRRDAAAAPRPVRCWTASARPRRPITGTAPRAAASGALAAGSSTSRTPRRRPRSAMARPPRTERMAPSRPELAADEPAVEGLLRELLVGGEHRQGDGEVEVVALLAQVGGREIDDDGLRGPGRSRSS